MVRGMVLELLEVLQPSQIGVIALYKAQAVLIRKLLVCPTVQDCLLLPSHAVLVQNERHTPRGVNWVRHSADDKCAGDEERQRRRQVDVSTVDAFQVRVRA